MERPSGPAHLFLNGLVAIESEFGMKLHDDIVALLAFRDPVLELFTGLTLDGIAQAAEELSDGELHARVGISRVYHEPVGEYREGLHGGPYLEFFTTRRPARNEARIWVHEEGHWWTSNETEEHADRGAPFTLSSLLVTMIERELREEILTNVPVAVPERIPFLIAADSVCEQHPKIIHPKFGQGSLLRRIGDGPNAKLVIDFDGTERTIAARFVEEA